jgi:zinc D-Ala-D-Ala dipeptidase
MYDLDYKVPLIRRDEYGGTYRTIPHDPSHPRAAEPLILLDTVHVAYRSHYARTDGGNWPYHHAVAGSRSDMWLRLGAAEALVAVNRRLRPFGFEVLLLDGYRSVACQQALYDFYLERGRSVVDDPTEEACRAYADGFVSDTSGFSPTSSAAWPLHSTGGAVDTTLRSLTTGELADMGARFEDLTDASESDYFERKLLEGAVRDDDSRLWHRRLLHWALHAEDWMNSPWVFWHYDWGTQLYVHMRKALRRQPPPAAWYGYIGDPPPP